MAIARKRTTWAALSVAALVGAATAVGWATGSAAHAREPAPSIRIIDVRPLQTPDPSLRDLITHTFAVRVAIRDWTLLPYQPGKAPAGRGEGAGHWAVYLDGRSLGTNFGAAHVTYTPYLIPGTHWLAAELRSAADKSLEPPVWSEPVVIDVPRRIRCWQSGWRGSTDRRAPTFACRRRQASG